MAIPTPTTLFKPMPLPPPPRPLTSTHIHSHLSHHYKNVEFLKCANLVKFSVGLMKTIELYYRDASKTNDFKEVKSKKGKRARSPARADNSDSDQLKGDHGDSHGGGHYGPSSDNDGFDNNDVYDYDGYPAPDDDDDDIDDYGNGNGGGRIGNAEGPLRLIVKKLDKTVVYNAPLEQLIDAASKGHTTGTQIQMADDVILPPRASMKKITDETSSPKNGANDVFVITDESTLIVEGVVGYVILGLIGNVMIGAVPRGTKIQIKCIEMPKIPIDTTFQRRLDELDCGQMLSSVTQRASPVVVLFRTLVFRQVLSPRNPTDRLQFGVMDNSVENRQRFTRMWEIARGDAPGPNMVRANDEPNGGARRQQPQPTRSVCLSNAAMRGATRDIKYLEASKMIPKGYRPPGNSSKSAVDRQTQYVHQRDSMESNHDEEMFVNFRNLREEALAHLLQGGMKFTHNQMARLGRRVLTDPSLTEAQKQARMALLFGDPSFRLLEPKPLAADIVNVEFDLDLITAEFQISVRGGHGETEEEFLRRMTDLIKRMLEADTNGTGRMFFNAMTSSFSRFGLARGGARGVTDLSANGSGNRDSHRACSLAASAKDGPPLESRVYSEQDKENDQQDKANAKAMRQAVIAASLNAHAHLDVAKVWC